MYLYELGLKHPRFTMLSWCLHVIAPCCLIELTDKISINAGV